MVNLKKWKEKLFKNNWLNQKKSEFVTNGIKIWADGPAVTTARGTVYWMQNGLKHRVNGPAVIHSYGEEEWWINGYQIK
jgi:hypothetical protein